MTIFEGTGLTDGQWRDLWEWYYAHRESDRHSEFHQWAEAEIRAAGEHTEG